jgi:hypothetical protein
MIKELNTEEREGKITILGYDFNLKENNNIHIINLLTHSENESEDYIIDIISTNNIHFIKMVSIENMPDDLKSIVNFIKRYEKYCLYLDIKEKEKIYEKRITIVQDLYRSRVDKRNFYESQDNEFYNLFNDLVLDYEEKVNRAFKDLEQIRIPRQDFIDILEARIVNHNDTESYQIN